MGGGIIGTSTAYHLAALGCKDVVLLERDALTSGTTWHAAGLMVTFGSTSETSTRMRQYTRELYSTIPEEETGQSTGFQPIGFIEVATTPDRLEEYRRVAAFNRHMGVDVHEISPEEVKRLWPLADTSDVLAGFYVEDDGRVNPVDAAMAFSKGARMRGATVVEGIAATGVTRSDDGRTVTGVTTTMGTIEAEYVVNTCGMWARQFGEKCGVNVPLQAAEHYYLITDAMDIDPSWPVLEDPSSHAYYRKEGAGLMVGLFEPVAAAWNVGAIPEDSSFTEIEPDWERMAPFLEKAMARVPDSLGAGVKTFFCGPESFTPDLAPIVGEAPELRNYFVGAGMNSIGILTGGGIGRALAHWVRHGEPDVDVTGFNIDRLHPHQRTPAYRAARVVESLGKVYLPHYPTDTMKSARNVKRSPLHARLEAQRACFKDVSGWEGPDWYAPEGEEPVVRELGWGRAHWFGQWAHEHEACRSGAALIDMSFMSKFLVQGPDAGRLLNYLSTADVDGPADCITYTQWLNGSGRLEADLTVTKLGGDQEGKFLVVATDTMHRHVEAWMNRHIMDGIGGGGGGGGGGEAAATAAAPLHATVTDISGGMAQINVQGPRSRELLQLTTSADLSDAAFPFRTARSIDVGLSMVTCARITYVGELGYELFVPAEQAVQVYDTIMAAASSPEGRAAGGITHVGLRALGSLRMEKGYRDYGHDMDNTDTLLEVGLGFTCDFDKANDGGGDGFLGQEAVLAQKAEGTLKKRLVQVLCSDPEPMMYHAEIVYRDGVPLGDIRAASYGHSLGGAVGLAMIEADTPITPKFLREGSWEVDIAGTRYPATASLKPLYDPKNERIRL